MKEQEEKMQKLYLEFQVLNNTIKQLENQNNVVDSQLMELAVTSQSIDELKNIKKGTEILIPISTGIFAKAELKDNEKFIVNVGSNITLKKDIDSTKKLVQSQIEDLRKLQEDLINELQNSTSKAAVLEREINKIASTMQHA